MNDIKPIIRSPALQPLSREHHDGLLFVWKLRQGLKNGTRTEKLGDFVRWYWKNHIRPHFFQEEKILMPLMAEHPLAERMKVEHDYIRELVFDIDRDPLRDDFLRLADLVERHIRFEERNLFKHLEDTLSTDQLSAILEQLEKHPVEAHAEKSVTQPWKDEFWVIK